MSKKLTIFIVLVAAFLLRLYKIDNPVADWHSWRQADTAAVARNFLKFGFDPLRPRFDDLSNIPSGMDNPKGWRMVEFPIYQLIGAGLFRIFGIFSIEVWLRLVSVFASTASAYLIYKLGVKYANYFVGITAAGLFAILPYSVYYGRVILPEPLSVFFALLSLVLFACSSLVFVSVSAITAAFALLVKPTSGFILIPLIYIAFKKYKFIKLLKSPLTYLYIFIVFAPFLLWRFWIRNFPEGIPVYTWLLNGDGIRFKGAWFYWIFGERIAKLILGFWGGLFLGLGFASKKKNLFLTWLGVGSLLYLTIFATGNVKHDYYQIIILPAIVFFAAEGIELIIFNRGKIFSRITSYLLLVVCCLFMIAFSWRKVRTYYWINEPKIIKAGEAVNKLTPPDSKVIAPYGGDTAFLYQTNRQGWPIGFDIEDKIKKGADYYVSINPGGWEEENLKKKYKVLKETKDYIIIRFNLPE